MDEDSVTFLKGVFSTPSTGSSSGSSTPTPPHTTTAIDAQNAMSWWEYNGSQMAASQMELQGALAAAKSAQVTQAASHALLVEELSELRERSRRLEDQNEAQARDLKESRSLMDQMAQIVREVRQQQAATQQVAQTKHTDSHPNHTQAHVHSPQLHTVPTASPATVSGHAHHTWEPVVPLGTPAGPSSPSVSFASPAPGVPQLTPYVPGPGAPSQYLPIPNPFGGHYMQSSESRATEAITNRKLKEIPKYNVGDKVSEWVKRIRDILSVIDPSPHVAKLAIISALEPAGSTLIGSIPWRDMTVGELLTAISRHFGGRAADARAQRDLDNLTRAPGHTPQQWAKVVIDTYEQVEPNATEAKRVSKYLSGFTGRMKVIMNGLEHVPETVMDASEIAATKEYALSLEEDSTRKPAKTVNIMAPDPLYVPFDELHQRLDHLTESMDVLIINQREHTRGELICYNCHLPGHFAKDCKEERTVPNRQGRKKWCDFHKTSKHDNTECRHDACKRERTTPGTPAATEPAPK